MQPCSECGARLRLSSMALLSTISALGLIGVSVMYLVYREKVLLYIALVLTLLMLVAMLSTRLEKAPSALPAEAVQLYYQIALKGREDLPFAPDARSALEMTLLRMLAFTPAGIPKVPQATLAAQSTAPQATLAAQPSGTSPAPAPAVAGEAKKF